jgi:predicted O-methyltransferase YrrM
MDFIQKEIEAYAVAHTQPEPLLLQQLSNETWRKVLAPRMLSGHLQGRLLSLISKLIHPKNILEIGTYTGYSALCLMEGIRPDGVLHTIDINEELYALQRKYFNKSGMGDRIVQHVGNALDIIPTLTVDFDLVFIDADKNNYPKYLDLLLSRLKSGAVILSDNVLWSGKVIQPLKDNDEDTKALLYFNKIINEDARLETVLLPIRDGLTISRII